MTDHAASLRAPLEKLMLDADMPRAVRTEAADAHGATDIEAVLFRAARALIAIESVVAQADAHVKALRAGLVAVMEETGAPSLDIGTHTVGTSLRRSVYVTDEAALPISFMRQPPPKPDTDAIGKALRAGATVPGAELGNGVPFLSIRSKKQ